METRRQPLKRLCSNSGIESPRKKRLTVSEDGTENCEDFTCSSSADWSTLLRLTEQEIKPDTPAIPSVRSRIQMLRENSRTEAELDSGGDSHTYREDGKEFTLLTNGVLKGGTDKITGQDVSFEWEKTMDEPLAHSTIAPRQHLLSRHKPASAETASRLRKERQEELAMVSFMVDRSNPWRVESMRQRQKWSEGQASGGSDPGQLSLESSSGSLDQRYVSSLEVHLKGTIDSDSFKECSFSQQEYSKSPSFEHTEESNEDESSGCIEDVKDQVTMDNSELINRLFEGVLDSSPGSTEDPLDLPPVSLLSPLTKSADLQAAISPLNSVVSSLPELLTGSPDTPVSCSPGKTHLPYSIDKYRTMKRNAQDALDTQPSVRPCDSPPRKIIATDLKEKIKFLSKEVSALQRIIEQSCRALSCCVDAEHGKGTLQEAEAERLLLVSMEKRKALLKELDALRNDVPGNQKPVCSGILKPCHSSITISDIQLPLKVDYVCSDMRNLGNPSHYFLVLIRYGTYDIVATQLASAADAQTGDTILFPTTVTLNDASSDFRIEIEVYSLGQSEPLTILEKRKTSKPKLTPKKLLGSRKSSLASPACSPALSIPVRSSRFLLVGSLTLSLDSLGKFKFPLEKMKLEGKVGRLLGNHFQDKVPFLSPLEGSLYLKLHCRSHSTVQHKGFLTMFEDVSGLGSWHRRWCVLSGNYLSYWTYPDQETLTEPLGQINLANCTSAQVEAAKRETCARPHTLELITMRPQREDDMDTLVTQCRNTLCFTKNWLSADTKEQKNQWMDYLNQVLVDLRTWRTSPGRSSPNPQLWQTLHPSVSDAAPSVKEPDC
ncbi:anillin-like isoform X2 [Pelobates fuscus]|uniref:anillin-like isoform X2 n=1 Tax=Pelobates fuscus TaxID=191477 RepID=UPI002FE4C5FC